MITLQEKIEVIGRMIELQNRFRPTPDYTLGVLKAIAKDLRARQNGAPSVAETELGRRINAVQLAEDGKAGNLGERLTHLGQETISRWAVVSQALERFGAEIENELDQAGPGALRTGGAR